MASRPIELTCCCCGRGTMGRQWWNRDKGFGVCTPCLWSTLKDMSAEEIKLNYGIRGVHFQIGVSNGKEKQAEV